MWDTEIVTWAQAVLAGMAQPWVIAVTLAATTLVVEDVAIAAGVSLATQGAISWELSVLAVGGGITSGDLGLYALGVASRRLPWLQRRAVRERTDWVQLRLERGLASAVLIARVTPGLRLATYVACGFVGVPLAPFTAWVVCAVTLWTVGLFALSVALGHALAQSLGVPVSVAVALPLIALALAFPLLRSARRRLERAAG